MVKKKIDPRIRALIENGVQTRHRSLFIMVGDHGQDQVANLHYILSKAQVAKRPSVLWCYKKELGFSSHQKKRMKQMKKKKSLGLVDAARIEEDPFELFLSSTDIRFAYYHETDKILGNTFGMGVLQDFEALTPNLLARTVETVSGGGVIILLLQSLTSLKQLYTMTMDVHSRYRTEGRHDPVARFNERFLLSLVGCESCLILDDQLNVLPVSTIAKEIIPLQRETVEGIQTPEEIELAKLKKSLGEDPKQKLTSPLASLSKTLDQAKVIQSFLTLLNDQNGHNGSRTTVSLTAARGRGKSAALGLTLAAAVSLGFGNIFVTAPSPENLKTLFEFVFKGLDALGYSEHLDYDIVQSTHVDFNKAVVRVNVFKGSHRQTILYIHPQDSQLLSQAELIIIDEAAAIPLPLVQALSSGPQLVFMASTINGYEGTGRSLSLKLIQQLRNQSGSATASNSIEKSASFSGSRILKELTLNEPIRYGANDPVEKWLNGLLCLDVASIPLVLKKGAFPAPATCDLYAVNRDTLFSYHKASETFLQRMMALYVASHYKNTPNDLQLMSDAPAHRLYVLLAPVDEKNATSLPEILAVVQVAFEGALTKETVLSSLARGRRAGGDLIPWTISQQFQEDEFASLSGARVVRIAVHPELQGMGYGSRSIKLLEQYYTGKLYINNLDQDDDANDDDPNALDDDDVSNIDPSIASDNSGVIKPRSNLKPLLVKLTDRKPILLDWMGVSFGVTAPLFGFWKRLEYRPVYVRQTTNDITGEHTAIVLKKLGDQDNTSTANWLEAFNGDFYKRFVSLLGFQFRSFLASLSLDLLSKRTVVVDNNTNMTNDMENGIMAVSMYDLKRLESYANNMVDYHMIIDLVPYMARHYFLRLSHTGEMNLSPVQAAILLAIGLQHRTMDDLEKEIKLPVSQLLATFIKCARKFAKLYRDMHLKRIETTEQGVVKNTENNSITNADAASITPAATPSNEKRSLDDVQHWKGTIDELKEDLDEAASQAHTKLREKQRELINALDLQQYKIGGDEDEWKAEIKKKGKALSTAIVNIGGAKTTVDATTPSKERSLSKGLFSTKDRDLVKKAKKSKYAK